jgi:cytochrome c oxidase subunit 3
MLSPTLDLGERWVCFGTSPVNPFALPLFNTVLLLSSGATVTWRHHCLIRGGVATPGLTMTLVLACLFEAVQGVEYKEASFSIRDGVFGRTFFMATGFHGLHVLFGGIFLLLGYIRLVMGHFSCTHHLSIEFAILYWHFVDVV